MLERVFEYCANKHVRLGDAVSFFDYSKEDLQECIHYRLAIAPNLDYFDSITECWNRIKDSN